MKLCKKTLEKLREIINGDNSPRPRSRADLVAFFKNLGFNDSYRSGFPSRCIYTDNKLEEINGTPEIDQCIKMAFAVIDYIENIDELDRLIADFNQYLAFDKWTVIRDNEQITFKRADKIIIPKSSKSEQVQQEEFLKYKFNVNLDTLSLDSIVINILKCRVDEVEACLKAKAPMAAIFLIGSIMEGLLLGTASHYPKLFNCAKSAPKDSNTQKVKPFPDWSLSQLIDTANEVEIIKLQVKKFSHVVREFRNYIHPYEQMQSKFNPDEQTALICYQVLKATIEQINTYQSEHK